MREVITIAIAGAAGALGRYTVSGKVYELIGERFPYGTLVVNVLGCLLLGLLMEVALNTDLVPPDWRAPLSIGFLGAFTTFSTFAYETVRAAEHGAWWAALTNVTISIVVGLAAMWLGMAAGRILAGGV